jgi:hypothetical protein
VSLEEYTGFYTMHVCGIVGTVIIGGVVNLLYFAHLFIDTPSHRLYRISFIVCGNLKMATAGRNMQFHSLEYNIFLNKVVLLATLPLISYTHNGDDTPKNPYSF